MRRVMSLWLPRWPTDRLRRAAARADRVDPQPRSPSPCPLPERRGFERKRGGGGGKASEGESPLVTAVTIGSRRLVAAANDAALAVGIVPGLPLADAQAFLPGLAVRAADAPGDAAALRRLAEWCGRWSPWTAPDGLDGIVFDITGCAHLRGGESRLAAEILGRIAGEGYAARAAIADTVGAAWALARFGKAGRGPVIVPPGGTRAALEPLPVAALRLPAEMAAGLERLGLKRIADLCAMPRGALAERFGPALAERLDQALGAAGEPVSPLRSVPARRARLAFAEPIATAEDLARACRHLVAELCRGLAAEGTGARRLELACYRVDGAVERAAIGTARASRDARHLTRLLEEKLAAIDPDLGIEAMVLAAPVAEPLRAAQLSLSRLREREGTHAKHGEGEGMGQLAPGAKPSPRSSPVNGRGGMVAADDAELAALLDRLGNRLGLANLRRLEPRASHWPERAVAVLPAAEKAPQDAASWPRDRLRPVRLLAPPEPIEATAPVPDDPPILFRWRRRLHRVRRADGPERIAGEWWRRPSPATPDDIRDYYRVEDAEGRRFWLYRAGLYRPDRPARWFLHGLFA